MAYQIFDIRDPFHYVNALIPASSTVTVSAWTADALTRLIDAIIATNNDTIDHIIEVALDNGGGVMVLGQVNVPTGSGFITAPAVDILAGLALVGINPMRVAAGFTLKLRTTVVMNTAKTLYLNVFGGKF